MAITINNGAVTVSVLAILGWSTSRVSGNIVHQVIGRNDPDVSLRDAGLRAGSIQLLAGSLGEATALEQFLTTSGVFLLVDTERPEVSMRFVLDGALAVLLDPQTAVAATVDVGFQEVRQ